MKSRLVVEKAKLEIIDEDFFGNQDANLSGSPKKTSVGSPVKKRSTGIQQKNRWKVKYNKRTGEKQKTTKEQVKSKNCKRTGEKWNLLNVLRAMMDKIILLENICVD